MNARLSLVLAAMTMGAYCCGSAGQDSNPAGMPVQGDPRQDEAHIGETEKGRTTADVLREAGLTLGTGSAATPEFPASPWDANLNRELLLALGVDDIARVEGLIGRGADVNGDMTGDGTTPLMIAQSAAMVTALLDSGADVNRRDTRGATALHRLVTAAAAEQMLPLLIAAGADVDAVAEGMNSQTPMLAARQLFFEGGDPESGERILRMLHRAGASVNAQDADGYTILITAAVNDKRHLAQLMVFLGADFYIRSSDGMTALDWARRLEHPQIEQILVTGGARQ